MTKGGPWGDWTGGMRMGPDAKAELGRLVLAAPVAAREAFDFVIEDGRVQSFTDRMLLLRADRD